MCLQEAGLDTVPISGWQLGLTGCQGGGGHPPSVPTSGEAPQLPARG